MFLCCYLRPISSSTLVAFGSHFMIPQCKKAKKFRKAHVLFNLLIVCAIQQGPVKVCSCYLIIISAAVTAASLTGVASLSTMETESTDFIKKEATVGPSNTSHV